ncbi:MAG TPA: hypothetical protein VFT65_19390 [Candidatus Angelobacter sp.]|nr:hypothetical protein [Candidatus Angelobacter sp.]
MLISLDTLNARLFAEQLHSRFSVPLDGAAPVVLELTEVSEKDSGPRIEFFSLTFRGPVSPRLAQQIHRLEHEKLGAFEIFLTAIAADAQGTDYESIFHRFRKTQP